MSKILNAQKAIRISRQLREKNKRIVLAGGCFDILHMGHVKFLENAKKLGDVLFVLLESDESVKKLKGRDRPINQQEERAGVLEALETVNHVVLLKNMKTDNDYDNLITQIKPHIIATTQNDPYKKHKERQAKLIKGKVAYVIRRIKSKSTTKLAKLTKKNYL